MKHRHDIDCSRARLAGSAWLDGELEDPSALRAHWTSCADCRDHAAALRRSRALFAPLRDLEPSVDLWLSIERRLTTPAAAPRGTRWLPRIAAAAAGFAAVIAAAAVVERSAPHASDDRPALDALAPIVDHRWMPEKLASSPEARLLASLNASEVLAR